MNKLLDWTKYMAGLGTALFLIMIGLTWLVGCATGTGPGGEIIIGMEVGQMAETVEQGLMAGLGMIPGIGPLLVNILAPAVAGGATVAGAARVIHNKVEARRKASDIAREGLRVELAEAKATNGVTPS